MKTVLRWCMSLQLAPLDMSTLPINAGFQGQADVSQHRQTVACDPSATCAPLNCCAAIDH
jgi:hypothetical protein